MSIMKKLLAAGSVAILMLALSAAADPEAEEMDEPEAEQAAEPIAAPVAAPAVEPVAVSVPEPVVAPAAEPAALLVAPAVKPKSELKVEPYGAVQYRLRAHHSSLDNKFGDLHVEKTNILDENGDSTGVRLDSSLVNVKEESFSALDYSNRFAWRAGLKIKYDDQFSMQFQIGNDWGASEGVNWGVNNGPRARAFALGYQNLYVHLAFFRWNPGCMFVEAGVVPLNSNGTLDLLESSLTAGHSTRSGGRYSDAIFNGWGEINNSLIGLKLGVPIAKEDVKVSAELFQTVLDSRTQSVGASTIKEPLPNPASALFVLSVPVEAGDFKITPELTYVLNRTFTPANEAGDDEILFGAAASYKVNKEVSLTTRGGFGMMKNEFSKHADSALVEDNGVLLGIGTSIKAGPGTIQFALDYNSTENVQKENTKHEFFYTDLRYAWKVHDKVTITPRYRTYTYLYPEVELTTKTRSTTLSRMNNRFELMFDGSF